MKMDIILSKWCLAILFAFGILACTDGSDANELPKEPEGTGETQDEKIPAFPGAEGHGRYTTGGRGGDVYIVTSLEDKLQDGTLRYGIEKLSGKRTIVFQVSGQSFPILSLSVWSCRCFGIGGLCHNTELLGPVA